MQSTKSTPSKKLLYIGIPLAVVIPLLLASWFIGPASIWLWVGVGVGMLYVSWRMKRQPKQPGQAAADTQAPQETEAAQ